MADDQSLDALSRHWNAVVRGEPVLPEAGPDPSLIDALAWATAQDDTPAPDPAFVARLEGSLVGTVWQTLPASAPVPPRPSNGRVVPEPRRSNSPARPIVHEPRRSPMALFATALLLLVTFLGIYLAFRPQNQSVVAPVGGTPTVVPSATPIPGVEITDFGAVAVPIAIVRSRSAATPAPLPQEAVLTPFQAPWWITMGRVTLAPGEGGSLPAISPATGIGFELLLQGSFTVSSGATLHVVRADGTTEEIPMGTEVTLAPGDSVVHLDTGARQSWHNPGQTEAVLLGAGFYTSNLAVRVSHGTLVGVGGITGQMLAAMDGNTWNEAGLPDGPVVASFRRLTLAPGTALPPAPEIYPTLRWIESGELGWTPIGGGIATRPPGRPMMTYFGWQQPPWSPSSPGVQIVLSNPSETEPLIIWEVVMTPAGPSPPATATS
jgi:hypothetical protein